MKLTINIDCTPEEARTFLGLPDIKPVQDRMIAEMMDKADSGLHGMDPTAMMQSFMQPSLGGMQQFWEQVSRAATGIGGGAATAAAASKPAETNTPPPKPPETKRTKVNPDGTPAHKAWGKDEEE